MKKRIFSLVFIGLFFVPQVDAQSMDPTKEPRACFRIDANGNVSGIGNYCVTANNSNCLVGNECDTKPQQ